MSCFDNWRVFVTQFHGLRLKNRLFASLRVKMDFAINIMFIIQIKCDMFWENISNLTCLPPPHSPRFQGTYHIHLENKRSACIMHYIAHFFSFQSYMCWISGAMERLYTIKFSCAQIYYHIIMRNIQIYETYYIPLILDIWTLHK